MEWEIVDGKLVQLYQFDNQTKLAEFLLKVAKYADSINHHPDYRVFNVQKLNLLCLLMIKIKSRNWIISLQHLSLHVTIVKE